MISYFEVFCKLARESSSISAITFFVTKERLIAETPLDQALLNYCEAAAFWPNLDGQLYRAYLLTLIQSDIFLLLNNEDIVLKLEEELTFDDWDKRWKKVLNLRPELVDLSEDRFPLHPIGYASESLVFPSTEHFFQGLWDEATYQKLLDPKNPLVIWDVFENDATYGLNLSKLYHYRVARYGQKKLPALMEYTRQMRWKDPHKGPNTYFPLELPVWKEELQQKESERVKRSLGAEPLKCVHIVTQLISATHAPTQLLQTLVHYAEETEQSVISTERLVLRIKEMPLLPDLSGSSLERGGALIRHWQTQGISLSIADTHLSLRETANWCVGELTELEADIVIFHGPDAINQLIAVQCDVPFRVFFDHGTLPESVVGFDFAILSTESGLELFNGKATVLPFAVDVKEFWQKEPFGKKELGLSEDDLFLTTVSNSLSSRLGKAMCEAIVAILQQCPKAYYLPIGHDAEVFWQKQFFAEAGVGDRVRFLGARNPAAQWVRSADLYLNEFPFGSGLAVLEAMAAGVPVLALDAEEGPAQGRYGALYMGKDFAVKTSEAYIKKACELLNSPSLRKEWGDAALARYQQRMDRAAYARAVEQALIKQGG